MEWVAKIIGWFFMIWSGFKDNIKCKRWNAIKYKKEKFPALTPIDILAIPWVTSIGLRWFLCHFEANT